MYLSIIKPMKINVDKLRKEVALLWLKNNKTSTKDIFDSWLIGMVYITYSNILRSGTIKSYGALEALYKAWIELEDITD